MIERKSYKNILILVIKKTFFSHSPIVLSFLPVEAMTKNMDVASSIGDGMFSGYGDLVVTTVSLFVVLVRRMAFVLSRFSCSRISSVGVRNVVASVLGRCCSSCCCAVEDEEMTEDGSVTVVLFDSLSSCIFSLKSFPANCTTICCLVVLCQHFPLVRRGTPLWEKQVVVGDNNT